MTHHSKLFRLRPLPPAFRVVVIRSNRSAAKPTGDESYVGTYRPTIAETRGFLRQPRLQRLRGPLC
jgi:hypothetical protein